MNENPSRVNIKQLCGRGSDTLSWNPVKEVLLKYLYCKTVLTELEDQTTALQTHSSGVKIQDHMLDHQDKYMMKAQVHMLKSFAISDIQALPRRKYLLLSSGKANVEGEIVSKAFKISSIRVVTQESQG
nr:hypothetical protein [Tanacetum cinerariifolium]